MGFWGGGGVGCLRQQLHFPYSENPHLDYLQAQSCGSVCNVMAAGDLEQRAFPWHITLERSLLNYMDIKEMLVLESEGGLAVERYW